VFRPYLIRLLEEGKIRYHLVGSHRRVRVSDLIKCAVKPLALAMGI